MADGPRPTGFSLRRWSQRKLAARRPDESSAPSSGSEKFSHSRSRFPEATAVPR